MVSVFWGWLVGVICNDGGVVGLVQLGLAWREVMVGVGVCYLGISCG